MKNNASLIYNVCLVVGDFLALVAAFVAAYILRVKLDPRPLLEPIDAHTYLAIFLAVLPFWIMIFALLGLYNTSIYEKRFQEFGRLLIGSFIGLLVLIFCDFVVQEPLFPARLVPIYGFALGFLFLLLFRNIARFIRITLFSFNIGLTHVVLVGRTTMTQELLDTLIDSRRSGYKIIAVVGAKRLAKPYPVLSYDSFDEFLQSVPGNVHAVIQTELYPDENRNAEILTYAQEHHVSYRFVPGNSELFVGNLDVELFRSGVPVIVVRHTALFGWGRVVKRISDLVLGGALLLLSVPLLFVVAVAVKLSDPSGPIFYRPKRLTRFGTNVHIFKFRTIKQAYNALSPEDGFRKMGRPELIDEYRANGDQLPKDPRVSIAGRFLRASSLDELPQLINVVRGDISLVGPRALDAFELEQFAKKNLILSVKSGLTGLAIVSGRKGISFEERRKLDLYYVQNWSLWLDLVILAKTLRVVVERFGRRGARY